MEETPIPLTTILKGKGIYHKVQPGETLWRIAKAYNVGIDDLIKANKILDAAKIEKNQLIYIPGADRAKSVAVEKNMKDGDFIWPAKGKIISYFGDRKSGRVNRGIDIQSKEGAQVYAARSGRVVFSDYLHGYAYTIIMDHSDGFYSIYAQNSRLFSKLDDVVAQGTPIAEVGRNNNNDLAFLHFEIRKNAKANNPLFYLP